MVDVNLNSKFSRIFIQIQDGNKFKRKNALENINKEVIEYSSSLENDIYLIDKIITLIFDEGECNRELVCNLLEKIVKRQKDNLSSLLPKIIPELTRKLGDKDNIDQCEEIRVKLLNLLYFIVLHSKKHLSLFMADCMMICFNTLMDNFAEIKRISCYIITELSNIKDYNFYNQCEQLLKPLIGNLCHQHSKVRVDTINCLGDVLLGGSVKSFDSVCSSLAQRLFDDNLNVRKAVIEVFGKWLLDLTDRYSYHAKLIPVFLSGFIDDHDEIRELTDDLWQDIGMKFQQENETDLKEQIDFEQPILPHYPDGVERPNLGCRTLLFRHVSKILPPLTKDLVDWSEQTRIKAAQLLPVLIINTEQACTQHCQLLIGSTLIRGLVDDNEQVRQACRHACSLLGYFVRPRVWWKIFRGVVGNCDSDDNFLSGQLILLSCIIETSLASELTESSDGSPSIIEEICHFLNIDSLSYSLSNKIKLAGLRCVENIVQKIDGEHFGDLYQTDFSYHIFYSSFAFGSYYDGGIDVIESSNEICEKLLDQLNLILDQLTNYMRENIYCRFIKRLLCDRLLASNGDLIYTNDICREMACLLLIKGANQMNESTWDILIGLLSNVLTNRKHTQDSTGVSVDLRTKTRVFVTLLKLLVRTDDNYMIYSSSHLMDSLLKSVFLPNLAWQAGRTAEALRKLVTLCVWTTLANWYKSHLTNTTSRDEAEKPTSLPLKLYQQLLTRLLSVLDDDLIETRQAAGKALVVVFDSLAVSLSSDCFSDKNDDETSMLVLLDQLHKLYPSLLKRLDDSDDNIRILSARLLTSWLSCMEKDFSNSQHLYQAHIQELCAGALIHLDDFNDSVQNAVYQVLLKLCEFNPDICREEIEKAKEKHRSKHWCDKLLATIQ